MRKADRSLSRIYDHALHPAGLLTTQFSVLRTIQRMAGPTTVTNVAHALRMDRTTLPRNLQPLVRDGLVQMATGHDRRERVVHLTDSGELALLNAVPLWDQVQGEVSDLIGPEQRHAIEAGLRSLIQLLDSLPTGSAR